MKNFCHKSFMLSLILVAFFGIGLLVGTGCSRINIPGADDITSIKAEVCYKTNFCLEGEGKTLDEVADSLELQYKAVKEEDLEAVTP